MTTYATADELGLHLDTIRESPADEGVLELIVRRPAENEREVLIPLRGARAGRVVTE